MARKVVLPETVKDGDYIVFSWPNGCGQGGTAKWNGDLLTLRPPLGGSIPWTKDTEIDIDEPLPKEDCLDFFLGDCEGPVEYQMPLSGTGRSFPRCDKHWEQRLEIQRGIDERYPKSQPLDFDPTYAGERWDEDY